MMTMSVDSIDSTDSTDSNDSNDNNDSNGSSQLLYWLDKVLVSAGDIGQPSIDLVSTTDFQSHGSIG